MTEICENERVQNNIKFIQLIEKYPCIYNRKYDPQSMDINKAWDIISEETKLSGVFFKYIYVKIVLLI